MAVALVRSSEQPLAIFDLDRTLLPGSSLVHVARAAVRRGLVSPGMLVRGCCEDAIFRIRGAPAGQVLRLQARLLRLVAGVEEHRLRALVREIAPTVVADVRPAVRLLLDRHLDAGHRCVVLSASPDELVSEVARLLGAHDGLGTRAEVEAGRYTGRLDGALCYGAGKIERLRSALGPVDAAVSHAYADSMSDLPLLEVVGHPVAVSPDRGLRREATSRAWPIIDLGGRPSRVRSRRGERRGRVVAASPGARRAGQ